MTSVLSLPLASNFPPHLPVTSHCVFVACILNVSLTTVFETWHCLSTHIPPWSYLRRGGILENHLNLCHKNLTSTLNGYIGHFIISKVESHFSESSPFTPQANTFWPSVLENSSLAGILDPRGSLFPGSLNI